MMISTKFLFLTNLFIVSLCFKSFSQDQEIDILNPNLKLLEHYVKLYTDSVRVVHGLNAQQYDNSLYLAADNHARYLKSVGALSHYQDETDSMRLPADRVMYFDGDFNYLSENLASVYLFTSLRNDKILKSNFNRVLWSYQRTAQYIVDLWVNSPGHYTNLINQQSTHTAIAITLNEQNGALIIVQLFSKPKVIKVPDKAFFPYPKLELQPIVMDFLPHKEINRRLEKYGASVSRVKVDKGMFSTNFRTARKLFKWYKINSGIVLEQDRSDLFQENFKDVLGGNTRANGLAFLNTEAGLELNRKALFQKAKANLNSSDYRKFAGIKTPFVKDRAKFQFLFNASQFSDLLFTDGKYPYHINSFGSIPGDEFNLGFIPFDFEKPDFEMPDIKVNVTRSTVSFKIFYEQNKIVSEDFDTVLKEMKSVFKDLSIRLDTVLLEAKASIEGRESTNNALFNARARVMFDSLRAIYTGPKPKLRVRTRENWGLMGKQLEGSRLKDLLKESRDSVRNYATKNQKTEPMQEWLNEQRYGLLELKISTYDTVEYTFDVVADLYQATEKHYLENYKSSEARDSLYRMQSLYFDLFDKSGTQLSNFRSLPFYPQLILFKKREVQFLLYKGLISEKQAFKDFSKLAVLVRGNQLRVIRGLHIKLMVNLSLDGLSSYEQLDDFHYLDQFYALYYSSAAYRRWKQQSANYNFNSTLNRFYLQMIRDHSDDLPKSLLRNHWGNYYLRVLANEDSGQPFIGKSHIRALSGFKNTFVDELSPISTEEAYTIALFYNQYYQYSWSLDLLEEQIINLGADHPLANMTRTAILLNFRSTNSEQLILNLYEEIGDEPWCIFMNNPAYYSYEKYLYYSVRKLYCETCQ